MVAAANTAAFPACRFGKFRLLESIERDDSSELFRSLWQKGPGAPELMCVVKRLSAELATSPTFVNMFEEEARILALLDHPNIVRTFESGTCDGIPYLVMEWLDGMDLRRLLKSIRATEREIPVEVSVYVAHQLALGLAHAHSARDTEGQALHLVHRDVRPANVVLLRDGRVKLVEFGVAKASSFISLSITIAGISRRKPTYISPEQAKGAPLDGRSDLFSLGVVLWELLTGRPLFPPTSPREAVARVLNADLHRPSSIESEVPPELDAIVMRLLERDPRQRYQNAADVARDLGALLPVPADALRAVAMLVRGSVDAKTPTPQGIGPSLSHPFTLMLPALSAAMAKGAESLQQVTSAVSAAVARKQASKGQGKTPTPQAKPHPEASLVNAPTTEVDLEPAALTAEPSDWMHQPALLGGWSQPTKRRRLAQLVLKSAAAAGLAVLLGAFWRRLRGAPAAAPAIAVLPPPVAPPVSSGIVIQALTVTLPLIAPPEVQKKVAARAAARESEPAPQAHETLSDDCNQLAAVTDDCPRPRRQR